MSVEKMCSNCGDFPAITLSISKYNLDLDGLGAGWPETLAILKREDAGTDPDFYVIGGYCSATCIHQAGEIAHTNAAGKI